MTAVLTRGAATYQDHSDAAVLEVTLEMEGFALVSIRPHQHSTITKRLVKIQWNSDFSNLHGKRKLVREIEKFEISGVKLQ